jgi:hypothetical protein
MVYLLVKVVEVSVLLLVFFAGFRVYKLHTISKIKPYEPEANAMTENKNSTLIAVQETSSPKKNTNEVLDNYIGDFF